MAKKTGQKTRILELKRLFEEETDENTAITMAQLTERFSADRKSIYDDIAILCDSGFEIIKEKREHTTYYYHSEKRFETSELKLLADAVLSSRIISEKQSKNLIDKLRALSGPSYRKVLSRQIYTNKNKHEVSMEIMFVIDELQLAIAGSHDVQFRYYKWSIEKKLVERHPGKIYTVSPLTLAWSDENYYLVAYDLTDKRIKHFRVDKIRNILQTSQGTARVLDFQKEDIAAYLNKNFNMYGGDIEETVTLECRTGYMENVILDRFGTSVALQKTDETHFLAYVRVYPGISFLSWLMGFGSDVKILAPASVAEQMKALAEEVAALYSQEKQTGE